MGIDPHPGLLQAWGLPDTPAGVREFARGALEAVGEVVAAVKPQVAFFERHGSAGMAVLEDLVHAAAERSVLCIVDAKRGDIGSTMAGYAQAYLTDGAPFAGDALTVSPFLGVQTLADTVDLARANRRGVFILALTSNPEGRTLQHARTAAGHTVAADIARAASRWNRDRTGELGDVGLVVGATIGAAAEQAGVDLAGVHGPLLAPGVGAQGAALGALPATFGSAVAQVLVNSSRDILRRGPDPEAMRAASAELGAALRENLSRG